MSQPGFSTINSALTESEFNIVNSEVENEQIEETIESLLSFEVSNINVEDLSEESLKEEILILRKKVTGLQFQLKESQVNGTKKSKREPLPTLLSSGSNLNHMTRGRPSRNRRTPSNLDTIVSSSTTAATTTTTTTTTTTSTNSGSTKVENKSSEPAISQLQERIIARNSAIAAKPATSSSIHNSRESVSDAKSSKVTRSSTSIQDDDKSADKNESQEQVGHAKETSVGGSRKPVGAVGFGIPGGGADLAAALNRRRNNASLETSSERPSVAVGFNTGRASTSSVQSEPPAPLGARLGMKKPISEISESPSLSSTISVANAQPIVSASAPVTPMIEKEEPTKKKFGLFGRKSEKVDKTETKPETKNEKIESVAATPKSSTTTPPPIAAKPSSKVPSIAPSPISARTSVSPVRASTTAAPPPAIAPKPSAISASPETENEVRLWISNIIGEDVTSPLVEALKDGSVLGKLANKIKPDLVKYNPSKFKFSQIENINSYLRVSREINVNVNAFDPSEVQEGENFSKILAHLKQFRDFSN